MIGIVKSSLPGGREMSAFEVLAAASARGLNGLLFNTLHDISPTLDASEMGEVKAEADRLELRLSSSLGFLNPALPSRGAAVIEAGAGDLAAGVRRLIGLAADIGIVDLFFVIGMIEERFSDTVNWRAQCDAVLSLIKDCAPVLRERRARLLLKTHEEITTQEVVDLVEAAGPELLAIAFDPVNLVCRMEDPVAGARRVAPHVAQVHVDDAVVRFQEGGIRRFLATLGDGSIDWEAIDALMPQAPRWIEMHAGQFAMPIFDADWLKAQPRIQLAEYASVLGMANAFGSGDVPWDQTRPTDRLPVALERLLG